ncbi:MAG TPA: ABC transporter ATP-binding protein, partial [Acidaminococcaceae bacterium]|nr:ABC transporter ATP-binding protein [Acidaminococcaceae bacterium]
DDHDIRDVTVSSLREQVGIVPQETNLFNDTVYNNILYGRLDATREEVLAAAKAANADEFIQNLPQGYDTYRGDRGINVSGGQRQRIAIARAIVNRPKVVIADEPTGNLDPETSRDIMGIFQEINDDGTTIIMATHEKEIVDSMSKRVIAIDHGEIVRDELNGVYGYEPEQ